MQDEYAASKIEKPFYATINATVTLVRKFEITPVKWNKQQPYDFMNDLTIGRLLYCLNTITELNIRSREQLYEIAADLREKAENGGDDLDLKTQLSQIENVIRTYEEIVEGNYIGGRVYTERKAAGEAIQKAAIKFMAEVDGEQGKPIGTSCGFQLSLEKINNGFTVGTGISLRNKLTYTAEIDITGDINRVLVVAPLSIFGVWEEEFEKFADFPYSLTILKGTSAKKKEQLAKLPDEGLQIVVVNYESAWRLEKELMAYNPDLVIADEAHKLKENRSKPRKIMIKQ